MNLEAATAACAVCADVMKNIQRSFSLASDVVEVRVKGMTVQVVLSVDLLGRMDLKTLVEFEKFRSLRLEDGKIVLGFLR